MAPSVVDAHGVFAIYPVRKPLTTQRFDPDAFAPIDGYTLAMYAAVCRALVRHPGGSTRQLQAALADHGLSDGDWTRIQGGWSERIARDPFVRGAFRRLFVGDDAGDPVDRPHLPDRYPEEPRP